MARSWVMLLVAGCTAEGSAEAPTLADPPSAATNNPHRPVISPEDQRSDAERLHDQALKAHDRGDEQAAYWAFKRCIKEHDDYAPCFRDLGTLAVESSALSYKEAAQAYAQYLELEPKAADAEEVAQLVEQLRSGTFNKRSARLRGPAEPEDSKIPKAVIVQRMQGLASCLKHLPKADDGTRPKELTFRIKSGAAKVLGLPGPTPVAVQQCLAGKVAQWAFDAEGVTEMTVPVKISD